MRPTDTPAVWRCVRCGRIRGGAVRVLLDPRYATAQCATCGPATFRAETFPDTPGLVGREHPDTSRIAAATIPRTGTLRRRVYDAIRAAAGEGLTDAELQRELDMGGNTERPRRVELIGAGLIADSGRRRYEGGRPMIVWVCSDE